MRPLIDLLAERFKIMYHSGEHLSIDESMISTKCHLSFIQYLPNKPTKWGVKMWVLAESETAYISRFAIYTGTTYYLVVKDWHMMWYSTFCRTYWTNTTKFISTTFTIVLLSAKTSYLLECWTYSCGTVRTNRKGFPSQVKSPNLPSILPNHTSSFVEVTLQLHSGTRRETYIWYQQCMGMKQLWSPGDQEVVKKNWGSLPWLLTITTAWEG